MTARGQIAHRLDRPHHAHATYAYVGGAARCDHHAGLLLPVISVITITGIGDHLQPVWLITFTGMRSFRPSRVNIPATLTLSKRSVLAVSLHSVSAVLVTL